MNNVDQPRARLSEAALAQLKRTVTRPRYRRANVTAGIVHLGIGAFHRAHQAVMTEAALNEGATEWGIVAASLRSPAMRDALKSQDQLYTVAVREASGEHLQVIGAVQDVLVASENPGHLIEAMADPRIRIVSLTVTEKGYCLDAASGELDQRHPDIAHDVANAVQPVSAPGYLVAALSARRRQGVAPFTVLCCDNLPANGRTLRRALIALAGLQDEGLARYIEENVAFPSTMVDRIVPATSDDDRARIAGSLGLQDAWPVVTEPFSQWVIEDEFASGRPDWTIGGAEFVRDVTPYELMKLRLLNGAHSSLAYLGYLAGHETVADASNDPLFIDFLRRFWSEAAASLAPAPGLDTAAYTSRLLARFQNRAIRHRLLQIAIDGSQKLPQRLLATIAENIAAGRPIDCAVLGVAAFCIFASGHDEKGGIIDVQDPLAAELKKRLADVRTEPEAATVAILAMPGLFGALGGDKLFVEKLRAGITGLVREGVMGRMSKL